MMRFGGFGNMMAGCGTFWGLGLLFWAAVLIDLVLVAAWLWKQIEKKN